MDTAAFGSGDPTSGWRPVDAARKSDEPPVGCRPHGEHRPLYLHAAEGYHGRALAAVSKALS